MTVNTTVTASGPYIANGATTTFPFAFKVFAASDLKVFDLSTGVEVDYDPSSYAVSISDQSGSVVFMVAPPAPALIWIALAPPFTNAISFGSEEAFYPQSHNEGFDRSALRDQVLSDGVNRAIQVPRGMAAPMLKNADPGQFLAVDNDGNLIGVAAPIGGGGGGNPTPSAGGQIAP